MHSLPSAPHIAAFASFAKASSKARKTALFLFSIALLLAGGAAAVRGQSALDATTGDAGDGFNPDANNGVRAIAVQGLKRERLHLCWDTALRDLQVQLESRVSRIEVALGSASLGRFLVPRALGTMTGSQQ